jgi:uncharacterized membrane protein
LLAASAFFSQQAGLAMEQGENLAEEPGTLRLLERMLFFSDAVFAIVLTLLVLELRLPAGITEPSLFRGVLAMVPKLVSFATSFALVSVFWIAHLTITRRLIRFDWAAAWANLLFLFTITLTPFVSTPLGEYGVFGNAWRLYCLALIAIGLAQIILFLVIYRGNGRLIGGVSRRAFWHRFTRAISPCATFTILLALSLMGFARLSFYLCWVTIPAILILARFALGRGGESAD